MPRSNKKNDKSIFSSSDILYQTLGDNAKNRLELLQIFAEGYKAKSERSKNEFLELLKKLRKKDLVIY